MIRIRSGNGADNDTRTESQHPHKGPERILRRTIPILAKFPFTIKSNQYQNRIRAGGGSGRIEFSFGTRPTPDEYELSSADPRAVLLFLLAENKCIGHRSHPHNHKKPHMIFLALANTGN